MLFSVVSVKDQLQLYYTSVSR